LPLALTAAAAAAAEEEGVLLLPEAVERRKRRSIAWMKQIGGGGFRWVAAVRLGGLCGASGVNGMISTYVKEDNSGVRLK